MGGRCDIERSGKRGLLVVERTKESERSLVSFPSPKAESQVAGGGCSRNIQIEDAPAFCPEPAWKLHCSTGGGPGQIDKPEVWQAGGKTWKCWEGWYVAEAWGPHQETAGELCNWRQRTSLWIIAACPSRPDRICSEDTVQGSQPVTETNEDWRAACRSEASSSPRHNPTPPHLFLPRKPSQIRAITWKTLDSLRQSRRLRNTATQWGKKTVKRIRFGTEKLKRLHIWVVVKSTPVTPFHKTGESWKTGLYKARRAGERSLDLI